MAQETNKETPLKVLVAGGGIGGLVAALGLRQQGHDVTVFERTDLAKEFGAAIHIGPNGHGILKNLGIFPEELGANQFEKFADYDAQGELKNLMDLLSLDVWPHKWVGCHRVALHEKLKEKAIASEGSGIPVTLKTGSIVVDVDPGSSTVVLEDGSKYTGDIVLGADGVSSNTRKIVVGPEIKPYGSGKSMFRFMIPREAIQKNPRIAHFAQYDGCMTSWHGEVCRLVMYPCSNNTLMNFGAIHPNSMSPAKGEGWDQGASKEKLLEVFSAFGPQVKEMLDLVDSSTLKVWSLLDMDRIPRWYKGRLALLGDAAHPFMPSCVAMEDAASIVALLPRGTSKDDIPERLALYQSIRDERAHHIQASTRRSGQDLGEEEKRQVDWKNSCQYNFNHDEWQNSTKVLQEHLRTRTGPRI
ncbi:unnamed protein product [Clonostachys byssicola]|uniref:FAD-binding domain-containing protein n=1 Tax=Clonostachys byssicola TaxID=160290 RepID=A0A9N9U9N4_9HYPO|nr:unnamed protein product [Clonostachys byssicola]